MRLTAALPALAGLLALLGGGGACTGAPPSEASPDDPGFGGRIGRTMLEAEPWWPPEKRAPERAPNIVVVLADDLGFADLGSYGSEIDTPNLDRLADGGIRYTNYHSEPTCSPTRAALLTGINPHAVGFGFPGVPGGASPGFPGYTWELAEDVATAAEILRDNGYATLAVGKWHLSRLIDVHEAMSTTSWPTRRGFDRYYGEWGNPNLHMPAEIWQDNQIAEIDQYPPGYFYNDDLTDKAISMIRGVRQGDPDRPFFLYLALPAPHAPHNAKEEDIAKYRGRYDAGWDEIREARFERQKQLGLFDAETRLPARNTERGYEAMAWSSLDARQRELAARYMEVYAGLVDNVDQCFGRLRAAIEEMGEWENTIVIFTSDNGANREGFHFGSSQYGDLIFRVLQSRGSYDAAGAEQLAVDYENLDAGLIGGPQTLPDYHQAWAMAGNTPFRLYKATAFNGGHQVPLIVSWPAGLRPTGQIRSQYAHATDILPTLLDLTGLQAPRERAGRALREMTGVSFAQTLRDPQAPSLHTEQYTESSGSRRYYRDGWALVTLHEPMAEIDDTEWKLFDLTRDPTEIDDLAELHPERVAQMSAAWEKAAWDNRVFPMNEGSGVAFMSHAPFEERYARPLTLYADSPTVSSWRARWLMEGRSFTVRVSFDHDPGNAGTLVSHGGQGGGYGLYVEGDELVFILNGYGRMTELSGGELRRGAHEATLSVAAREGYRWDVEINLDGRRIAASEGLPMLLALAPIGGIDVGLDRRSPVSWRLYERHGVFRYGGKIRGVHYEPGEWAPEMDPEWAEKMRARAQSAR